MKPTPKKPRMIDADLTIRWMEKQRKASFRNERVAPLIVYDAVIGYINRKLRRKARKGK